jgi:hypothetical protein
LGYCCVPFEGGGTSCQDYASGPNWTNQSYCESQGGTLYEVEYTCQTANPDVFGIPHPCP